MLLPTRCVVCGQVGAAVCGPCGETLRPAPFVVVPPGLDACSALFAYEGAGADLVARLKFANHRDAVAALSRALATLVDLTSATSAVVTWAPTTRIRARKRGFDQAELLAKGVARALGRPHSRLLYRSPGVAQTGRPRTQRQFDPPVFLVRPRRMFATRVIIVDDVVTSGATLAAAARMLRTAGAVHVTALAVAATPRRSNVGQAG